MFDARAWGGDDVPKTNKEEEEHDGIGKILYTASIFVLADFTAQRLPP